MQDKKTQSSQHICYTFGKAEQLQSVKILGS